MKIKMTPQFAAYISSQVVDGLAKKVIPAEHVMEAENVVEQLTAGVLTDLRMRRSADSYVPEDPAERRYSISKIYTDAQVLRLMAFRDTGMTFRQAGRRAQVNENTAHELYQRGKKFFGAAK